MTQNDIRLLTEKISTTPVWAELIIITKLSFILHIVVFLLINEKHQGMNYLWINRKIIDYSCTHIQTFADHKHYKCLYLCGIHWQCGETTATEQQTETIFVYYYISSIDKYVKRLTSYWTEKQSFTWRYGFNTTLSLFFLLLLLLHFISLTDNISKYCRPRVQVFFSLVSHLYYSSLTCRFPDSICTLSRVVSLMLSGILLYGGGVFFLASLWFVLGVGYRL